jgi:hypothetical protein
VRNDELKHLNGAILAPSILQDALPNVSIVRRDLLGLRARGMPLGLMPGMSYEQKEIVLEEGEAALFYSDGLVEAHDSQRDVRISEAARTRRRAW